MYTFLIDDTIIIRYTRYIIYICGDFMSFMNVFRKEESFEELDRLRKEEGLDFEDLFSPGMLMSRKVYAALLGEDSLDWVENINFRGAHYERNM